MSPLKTIFCSLVLAGSVAAPTETLAQPKGPPPGGDGAAEGLRRDVMEKMRAMRAWKLAEVLKLDDVTSAKLFPLLAKYDDRERELARERNEIVRGLRAEVEAPKPENARINGYIDRLLASRVKHRAIEDEKARDLRKVLSPLQQAKILMLLPRIEQHFQQRIRDAMENRRRRRGGGDDPFGP